MSASAIPPSATNRGLAAAVNGRIRSDATMLAAKASLWRFGGIGLMLMLIGIGLGAALYGYAYVADSRTSYQQMASAFANALDHANLGRVKLEIPEATIKLDPESTIKVDPAALVHLDPEAKVAMADAAHPSEQQLQSNGKVVTNFTIFKTVALDAGNSVQTGWDFNSSEQTTPYFQYCHYRHQNPDGSSSVTTIAKNTQLIPVKGLADAATLAKQCVWFNGTATRVGT